jgi:hypothetical protein
MATESFPRVKRLGRGVDRLHHLVPSIKKDYSYTSTPHLGLRGLLQGESFNFTFSFHYLPVYKS